MSLEDQIRGAVQRHHDRIGQNVRLETHVETGTQDDHGHPIYDTYDVETRGEIVYRGTPVFERDFAGLDSDISAIVYIRDDVEIPINDTSADGSEATRVHILDGTAGTTDQLKVFNAFDEQNAKIRLHCVNYDG